MHGVENVKRKGVDLSLHYFKYLSSFDEFKDSKYYIIGTEGEGSDYLKKIVCELDLPDRVVFTGSIDEHSKREYLKKSKYYFQLSLYEGFGVGALEALAASCIVIHSGKGGLKEIIKDDGILLNTSGIDLDIINKIKSFNINKLESALNRVKETYDFTIRMREIGILLSES
jgi:glycosyltransferase involved in cell wall biosynthesis